MKDRKDRKDRKDSLRSYYIVKKKFASIFILLSLVFSLALIPLVTYLHNTFYELECEKYQQNMINGTKKIDDIVIAISNLSQMLSDDSSFASLRYPNTSYDDVPFSIQRELRDTLRGVLLPYDLISNAALQLDSNAAVSLHNIYFNGYVQYYPDAFSVGDMSYEEWVAVLKENDGSFLSVYPVKHYSKVYDALIYAVPWHGSSYLYVCMDITDVKQQFFYDSNLSGCYLHITNKDGTVIYNDLPDSVKNYQTLTTKTRTENLEVKIHIENDVFFQSMNPLYAFLTIYLSVYLILLVVCIALSSRLSASPFYRILVALERSINIPTPKLDKSLAVYSNYIADSIKTADNHLGEYKNNIVVQQEILRTRFFEKAVCGNAFSAQELSQLNSYFPDFPESYHLVLLRLLPISELNSAPYSDPIFLLHTFLQGQMPNAYLQQFSNTELLVVIPTEEYPVYQQLLDFVVLNIDKEEPSYAIRCTTSRPYQGIDLLSLAYNEICIMENCSDSREKLCESEERPEALVPNTVMTDLLTLYTAVCHGNEDLALRILQTCSTTIRFEKNALLHKTIYEMISSILTCIKIENAKQLLDENIASYQEGASLYTLFQEPIHKFCQTINAEQSKDVTPFVKEFFEYVDAHYTDYDFSLTTLEAHFKCSSSTINKIFKQVKNVTMSKYVEQKRLQLANELLAQRKNTIIEIANKCGFTNPNSFYKAYRRVYGHAPTTPLPNQESEDSEI